MLREYSPAVQFDFLKNCISSGWKLFPLNRIKRNYDWSVIWCECYRGLRCGSAGKCPRSRWADPANFMTETTLARWMDKGFDSFGVHLGHSGLVVLDLDPRNGANMLDLVPRFMTGDTNDDNFSVLTGSEGMHFYFRASSNIDPIRGFTDKYGNAKTTVVASPGVEILSGQHFVVAPWSMHKSGTRYLPSIDTNLQLFTW